MTADTFDWSTVRHGTNSGYAKHKQIGERPCEDCFGARAEFDRHRYQVSGPALAASRRANAAAYARARQRLVAIYRDVFDALYAEEKAAPK